MGLLRLQMYEETMALSEVRCLCEITFLVNSSTPGCPWRAGNTSFLGYILVFSLCDSYHPPSPFEQKDQPPKGTSLSSTPKSQGANMESEHQHSRANTTPANLVPWQANYDPWPSVHERYANTDEEGSPSGSPTLNRSIRGPASDVLHERFYEIFPWARGINPFDETQTVWRPAEWYLTNRNSIKIVPLDTAAEVPPAIAFMKGLVSLEMDDLEGDDHCPICLQKYREQEGDEMPLELPCKHVVGKKCLLEWFTTIPEEGAHAHGGSCPVCRRNYIKEKRQHLDTDEGLRQLLRDANYLLTAAGPLRLNIKGREQWEGVKSYVNGHLEEGRERMRQIQERFMMVMKQEIFRNPVLESIAATAEDLEVLRGQVIAELDDLERRGIIAAYLEVDSVQAEEELENEIAEHLTAAPDVLQRLLSDVLEGRFDYLDDSDDESEDIEVDIDNHTEGELHEELVADYVAQSGLTVQHYYSGRTIVIQPFQSMTVSIIESLGSDELLWCASCERTHREGSHHWWHDVEAEMEDIEMAEDAEDVTVEERMEQQLARIMQDEHDALMRERSMQLE